MPLLPSEITRPPQWLGAGAVFQLLSCDWLAIEDSKITPIPVQPPATSPQHCAALSSIYTGKELSSVFSRVWPCEVHS